jgi:hypothetical protein
MPTIPNTPRDTVDDGLRNDESRQHDEHDGTGEPNDAVDDERARYAERHQWRKGMPAVPEKNG